MSSIKLPPPELTRLVTIVAHVDHGKTTLADNLLESNGIISERLAGTLRYMDSNEEEQRRGITMKSSAIALRHEYTPPKKTNATGKQTMVMHLIDSPGHVDFGSEVTSALLACDGALLVVDVVEGMCARTHAVLREAYANQLVPILVINKIDRLQSDLGLTPTEAYVRIRGLIESVNAAAAAMIITANSEVNEENDHMDGSPEQSTPTTKPQVTEDQEQEEETVWNFEPSKGNVVFCSALHGWGFTVPSLSRSLFRSKALPFKPAQMRQVLFGDCRYNAQTEKIVKWRQTDDSSEGIEPIFAQYALRPLWNIYESIAQAAASVGWSGTVSSGSNAATKITATTPGMETVLSELRCGSTASVDATVPRTVQALQDVLSRFGATSEESVVRAVLRRYRPLSDTVLDTVCEICPSPSAATSSIRTRALALKKPKHVDQRHPNFASIERAVKLCDNAQDAPTVAHVCKFLTVKQCDISDPEMRRTPDDTDKGDKLMALVRVLSGTLRSTDVQYEVYGPKYDSSTSPKSAPKKPVKLYLLMGASVVRVDSIPAGHICAAADLSDLQLKTMTLCDTEGGMPLQGFETTTQPLVKVNVEAAKASETDILERGLLRLSLADFAVEVTATSRGERILACQGELHLEKAILELKKTYCEKPIELRISDPIADYGESTDYFEDEGNYTQFFQSKRPPLRQTSVPPYSEEEGLAHAKQGRCRSLLPDRGAAIRIRTLPLSKAVYQCLKERRLLDGSEEDLKLLAKALGFLPTESSFREDAAAEFVSLLSSLICSIDGNGNCIIESFCMRNNLCIKGVLSDEVYVQPAKGKHDCPDETNQEQTESEIIDQGTDAVAKQAFETLEHRIRTNPSVFSPDNDEHAMELQADADRIALDIWKSDMRGSIAAGFQLSIRAGPFFEEPVRGVLAVFEGVEIAIAATGDKDGESKSFVAAKPITGGMVVSAIRQGIRCSLLTRPARVAEAHLRLTLHTSLAGLGPLYAVLSKRRGKVISDTMVEGTDLILITANLPQSESFGLSQELLKQSSGEVTAPELVFSHFEVLKEDPFWVPTSEDEIEEFGEMLLNGEVSTGLSNKALSILRDVRKRKGLLVDSSKIVVAAEKQRTLSKKK